jgi:myosin heavy subunit
MHGMHRISPAFVPKNAAQSGDEERREAIRLLSPRADISSPLALRNSHNESGNDSTPRAKFLKAVADDRIAMHACTIDDLARLLEDADSAATSENVLKTAISLAINDIRERFAKAESTAKEEIECAAKEKSNAIISALKQEHQCVVDALILAQRDAMSSAVENEQVFIQHIAQLEKRLQEENQRKFDLKTRNEELEMTIADSALKLSRLDNVVGRASSLEKAVKEAWDRVIYTESKLKDQEAELADSVSQRFELQTLARSLESTLQVAEATLVTNHEAALKEKENFEKTIAQLRLDLNLSRDAVERARAQTDLMIGQLARGQAEKSAIVEAHAASLNCILARSTELEELHNDETARYFCLQNQLKVSNESVALAESRASAASEALESLKQEFAEFCSASESDSVRSLAMLNMLEIEFADFKSASQTKLVAAFSKEAAMEEEIKRLRDLVQEGTDIRASSASIVLQLEAKLQDSETETFALRNALQFALSDLNAAKIEMADLVAKNKEIEESNDVQPLSLMSIAEGLDAASKFIECAYNPTHDNTSCIAAIESTVTNGVHSVPHAKTVVQSSLLPPSLGLSQSPHLLPAEGTIGIKYDVKTSNGSPAKYDDALLCNGVRCCYGDVC